HSTPPLAVDGSTLCGLGPQRRRGRPALWELPQAGPDLLRPHPALDVVRRSLYLYSEHTFARQPTLEAENADGTAAGDLGLPRRLRRRPRLPADGARDRRGRGTGVALDGARPPCESRARRSVAARPDEAARPGARRARARRGAVGGGRAAAARGPDRGRRPAARGPERRGSPRRPRDAARRLPPAGEGRLDGQRRNPRRRPRP